MTAEVNESQFPKFSSQFIRHWSHNNTFKRKLLCRIPVFTIPWDLSRGYKTKVITLPPKISTITSDEEKNMNMSMEMLNSFNTCSSRVKLLFFVTMFLGEKCVFLQSLKVIFVKNPKLHWKAALWVRKLHKKFQGNISTNNIAIAN